MFAEEKKNTEEKWTTPFGEGKCLFAEEKKNGEGKGGKIFGDNNFFFWRRRRTESRKIRQISWRRKNCGLVNYGQVEGSTIGTRGPKKRESEGIIAPKNNVGMPKMTC